MVHKFEDSLKYGEKVEALLDDYFEEWFDISPVTPDLQRLGVDRIFVMKSKGHRYSVEYKADRRTQETGNVYIETVSVRKANEPTDAYKLGWALTSIAQRLIYYIEGDEVIYILDMKDVRDMLPKWESQYPKAEVVNEKYFGEGILVPVTQLSKLARGVRTLK